ncbi:hypothetical protein NDU88_002333 [Pleurodeles waltl]|uniref:Uncharacterized protein n=1 Tax=Pleurodeles waltl TaxID=8319 RepID=A0AAV7KT88_PLEWA|nr:hypothetical protein NDU88_002333 [Pleurodeles waltl]
MGLAERNRSTVGHPGSRTSTQEHIGACEELGEYAQSHTDLPAKRRRSRRGSETDGPDTGMGEPRSKEKYLPGPGGDARVTERQRQTVAILHPVPSPSGFPPTPLGVKGTRTYKKQRGPVTWPEGRPLNTWRRRWIWAHSCRVPPPAFSHREGRKQI